MKTRIARDGVLKIRVYGEPQPVPKKHVAKVGNRLIPVDTDFQTRRDPVTGKIKKYNHGYKKKWQDHVRKTVAIWNCLKRTPAKRGKPGRYPNGILFYDDDQIVWRLAPSGKLWATDTEPPGVLISVCDLNQMRHVIRDYMQENELPLTV